jgi:hypothetical protein
MHIVFVRNHLFKRRIGNRTTGIEETKFFAIFFYPQGTRFHIISKFRMQADAVQKYNGQMGYLLGLGLISSGGTDGLDNNLFWFMVPAEKIIVGNGEPDTFAGKIAVF